MHYFNSPVIFTSPLRYRLSRVLSDIRRMDTQNKSKVRLALRSLRYDITVISYVPNQMCFKIVLKIHPWIYAIQKSILFLLSFSDFELVNAQPMSLRLLKGTFSQQTRGYMRHLTYLLAPGGGEINHLLTFGKC